MVVPYVKARTIEAGIVVVREVVGGGAGGARAPPIIWDFAPIQYLLNRKIPIYCVPLQYKFTDYLPDGTYSFHFSTAFLFLFAINLQHNAHQ